MSDPAPKIPSSHQGASRLPAKIGRYDVIEKLGSGSTGTVYKATDPFIGRVLAIKTFRVDLKPGEQRDRYLQRFYHEARISGGLSHPNIVALFDVGETDGLPYLVFEHVEGPSLDVALARTGRLDSAETIRVVEQAASALDFAHARGVVHRDIRPANIILATDRRVRIADFGIARLEGSQLTQHGEILGTPAYMSPEQIRAGELSASSDLFSLAVCAYEMLSGERPFNGENQAELLEALVYSPPAEPKELRALGIPSREFMFVFERALAKDPAHRFADGASFARALKSCLGVVSAAEDAVPVKRIAVPEPPPAPKMAPLSPVSLADLPARVDTAATTAIEGGSGGLSALPEEPERVPPPDFVLPDGPTLATAKTEPGVRHVPPDISSEATLLATVGFQTGLKAQKPASSADATMVSPAAGSTAGPDSTMVSPAADSDATMVAPTSLDSEPPPTHRLSRQAVESLLARSSAGVAGDRDQPPTPVLQKTQPGSEPLPTSSSSSAIEGLLPPTREMPRLPASPPLRPSARDLAASKPGFTLDDVMRSASQRAAPPPKDAEQTVIMTETEKASAAKLRSPDRSSAKVPTPPPIPKPASIPPSPRTASVSRPAASVPDLRNHPPPAPRPSVVPKLVMAGAAIFILLVAAAGALYWGSGPRSSAATTEKWNELPVFPESDVEKTPFLLSSQEFPKMKLEPGRVVSVTVSWIVTPEGQVDDPKIVGSASTEIDAIVAEAVRKWRYEPGVKDGKTVPVRVLRKYTFPQGGGSS